MLVVDTIARIRRAHFVDGKSIKQITREFDLARNTVRRVLRSGETAFSYERSMQPRPKLGAWTEALDRRLAANDRLSSRERLDLVRIYEDLRAEGFEGGYDTVRRYAQARQRKRGTGSSDAYVPLSYTPGEAYQFDWSTEVVVLHGTTTIVQVAQVRLCHSRMPFVRAYPRQAQEMVFDAHDKAFSFYKGACQRGIYDNMRAAVDALLDRPRAARSIDALLRCAVIIWSSLPPALRRRAGRRVRLKTRSASCAAGSSSRD